jgi:hypothetical protein
MKRSKLRLGAERESEAAGPPSDAVGSSSSAPAAAEPEAPVKDESGGLAAIGVAVTGLVAALTALTATGTLGRVQRDDPGAIIWALGLVALAGGLWALAPLMSSAKIGKRLKVVGVLCGLAGFFFALNAAVSSADHEPRPQVSARLSGNHKTLTTTVTASNLSSTRRMAIALVLLNAKEEKTPIYRAFLGPTSDGTLDQTIVTPLPDLSPYSQIMVRAYTGSISQGCDEYEESPNDASTGSGTACVLISLLPDLKIQPAPEPKSEAHSTR